MFYISDPFVPVQHWPCFQILAWLLSVFSWYNAQKCKFPCLTLLSEGIRHRWPTFWIHLLHQLYYNTKCYWKLSSPNKRPFFPLCKQGFFCSYWHMPMSRLLPWTLPFSGKKKRKKINHFLSIVQGKIKTSPRNVTVNLQKPIKARLGAKQRSIICAPAFFPSLCSSVHDSLDNSHSIQTDE